MYSLESPHRGDSNEYTPHTIIVTEINKKSLNYRYLLPNQAPWLILSGSNYPCLEQFCMVPKMFEPSKFDCIYKRFRAFFLMDHVKHLENDHWKVGYVSLEKKNFPSRLLITKTCLSKYIEKFTTKKNESLQTKNLTFFHISAQNTDCEYALELPQWGSSNAYSQSMFLSRNKKNIVYPCKPQFYYIKVGFKGVKII